MNKKQNKAMAQKFKCTQCGKRTPATDAGGRCETDRGWLCNDCIDRLRLDGIALEFEDDRVDYFEFGGYTFWGVRNFTKAETEHNGFMEKLKFDGKLVPINYSHKNFYAVAPKPYKDLYRCEETGLLYCPLDECLALYE